MYSAILLPLLLLAEPVPASAAAPAASDAPGAVPTLPTPALVPAAPALPAAVPELQLPRAGFEGGALAGPAVLLAGLGAAAWVLRKRRRPAGRRVEVLETTSLGPKRSLVLARFDGELLVLGASEAGIQLLHHRPGDAAPAAEEPTPVAPSAPPREAPPGLAGLVTRLRRARPEAAPAAPFDALLAESAEDQELRRKLARGQGGSVR